MQHFIYSSLIGKTCVLSSPKECLSILCVALTGVHGITYFWSRRKQGADSFGLRIPASLITDLLGIFSRRYKDRQIGHCRVGFAHNWGWNWWRQRKSILHCLLKLHTSIHQGIFQSHQACSASEMHNVIPQQVLILKTPATQLSATFISANFCTQLAATPTICTSYSNEFSC